jgi:glycosyltransferase involved in cell wall biosynthesis
MSAVGSMIPPSADGRQSRVALCHDWLTGMRGGERVLEALCGSFPDAPIYTLIHNRAAVSDTINRHRIIPSWLQGVPGVMERYRMLLPLFPAAVAGLRVEPCDLLISASHCVAKSIRPPPGAKHLCYCFTPMRYAWVFQREYLGGSGAKRFLAAPLLAWLRRWDRRTASRVDMFVAISRHVQDRIKRFYGRESDIVHPPVNVGWWTPGPAVGGPASYDLVVSALVPYKRVDLAVSVYSRTGFPLKVVGTGGEAARLRLMSAPNVELLGWQPDEAIRDLYRGCRLLVFPGEEDFGIVPLEAQACGRPVVAFARGGAVETVVDGRTGVLFARQDEESLAAAVSRCAATAWDPAALRRQAEQFGPDVFVQGMAGAIGRCLAGARR